MTKKQEDEMRRISSGTSIRLVGLVSIGLETHGTLILRANEEYNVFMKSQGLSSYIPNQTYILNQGFETAAYKIFQGKK